MNYLQKKKLAFMSIVNSIKGFVRNITGVFPLTLTNCVDSKSITDYTLYGQSVQNGTPTPETPVEVESVGEKTRNLFNPKQTPVNISPYLGMVLENKTYTLRIVLKEGKTVPRGVYFGFVYWVSSTSGQPQANWFVSNGTLKFNSLSYNSSSNFKTSIAVYSDSGNTKAWNSIIDAFDIYLSEGTTSTNEPYGYKIPITASSKNLFDIDSVENSTYVSVTDGVINHKYGMYAQSKTIPCNVKTLSTGTYTLSCEVSDSVNSSVYIGVRVNGKNKTTYRSYKNPNWIRISYTFTLEEDSTINGIILQSDGNSTNFTNLTVLFRNIQLEKVDMPTDYEPYHEPITTNIYLYEPLRKVGDYADYIDFEKGKVVRRIAYERIDTVTTKSSAGLVFLSPISQKPMITGAGGDTRVGYAMSDKFARNTDSYGRLANKANHPDVYGALIQSYITSGKDNRVAYIFGDTSITTVALAQEAIGDGFDVFYALATPIETPIVLPTIPTFRGTSILNADTTTQPSNAEVTYYSTLKE